MPGAAQRFADELVREVEALGGGVVDLGRRPVVDDRLAVEVADCDADVLVAEVEAHRESRARHERQQDRRAAGVARPRLVGGVVLLDDACAPELADERGDGRTREARAAGQLGAARRRSR